VDCGLASDNLCIRRSMCDVWCQAPFRQTWVGSRSSPGPGGQVARVPSCASLGDPLDLNWCEHTFGLFAEGVPHRRRKLWALKVGAKAINIKGFLVLSEGGSSKFPVV
jgi:hypothetical protein